VVKLVAVATPVDVLVHARYLRERNVGSTASLPAARLHDGYA